MSSTHILAGILILFVTSVTGQHATHVTTRNVTMSKMARVTCAWAPWLWATWTGATCPRATWTWPELQAHSSNMTLFLKPFYSRSQHLMYQPPSVSLISVERCSWNRFKMRAEQEKEQTRRSKRSAAPLSSSPFQQQRLFSTCHRHLQLFQDPSWTLIGKLPSLRPKNLPELSWSFTRKSEASADHGAIRIGCVLDSTWIQQRRFRSKSGLAKGHRQPLCLPGRQVRFEVRVEVAIAIDNHGLHHDYIGLEYHSHMAFVFLKGADDAAKSIRITAGQ